MTTIRAISLTVPDLEAALRFYREALGFRPELDAHRYPAAVASALGLPDAIVTGATLMLGAQRLELLAVDPPGRPYPQDSTASDLWFQHCALIVADMAAAATHLRRFVSTPISQDGPQRLPPGTGSVVAWKFRDPFGHPLELLQFPEGVGNPDWHRPDPPLFMGIDHSAIAVRDAEASVAYYRERFGFTLASRTLNHGPEQSRLDGFADAEADVVALSPATEPPHLELLAYRTGTRRPRPAASTSADVAASRIIIRESGATSSDDGDFGSTGFWRLEADPDGHLILTG